MLFLCDNLRTCERTRDLQEQPKTQDEDKMLPGSAPTTEQPVQLSVETEEPAEAAEPDACDTWMATPLCGAYTNGEVMNLILGLASGAMIAIAIQSWNDCPGISDLPVFCVIFAVINISLNIWKFVFRINQPGGTGKDSPLSAIHNCGNMMMLGVGIWGAVRTFPNIECIAGDCTQCPSQDLFITSLIPSVIIVVVVVGLCLLLPPAIICSVGPGMSMLPAPEKAPAPTASQLHD